MLSPPGVYGSVYLPLFLVGESGNRADVRRREETDVGLEWAADPWCHSQLTMVACEDSWAKGVDVNGL